MFNLCDSDGIKYEPMKTPALKPLKVLRGARGVNDDYDIYVRHIDLRFFS